MPFQRKVHQFRRNKLRAYRQKVKENRTSETVAGFAFVILSLTVLLLFLSVFFFWIVNFLIKHAGEMEQMMSEFRNFFDEFGGFWLQ